MRHAPHPTHRALGLALALVPWVMLPGRWLEAPIDPKWPAVAAAMLICLALLLRDSDRAGLRGPAFMILPAREPFLLGAMLIVGGLVISSIASPAIGLGLRRSLREVFFVLFAVAIALGPSIGRSGRSWVIRCLLISMGAQSALMLAQNFFPSALPAWIPHLSKGGRSSMIGTLGNHEYVAGWLAVGLVMALALARERRAPARDQGPWDKGVGFFGLAALIGLVIFLTGARGAALAAAGALILGEVFSRRGKLGRDTKEARGGEKSSSLAQPPPRRSPLSVAAWLAGIVLCLAIVWGLQPPRERRASLPARLAELVDLHSPSMRHRVGLMTVTCHMILERPILGCGPGRFGAGFSETLIRLVEDEKGIGWWALAEILSIRYVSEAHCDPLQWWAEYGLPPAVGLSLMILGALTATAGALRRTSGAGGGRSSGLRTPADPTISALWLGVATMSLNMWTSFPLHLPTRAFLFWSLLGLLASATRESDVDQ